MANPFTGMTAGPKSTTFSLSEEFFCCGLLDDSFMGVYRATPDGRIVRCNNAFARMLGFEDAKELLDGVFLIDERMYADSGKRSDLEHMLENGGTVLNYESKIRLKDAATGWISECVHPVFDAAGNLSGYESLVADVTALVKARQDEALALDLCRAAIDAFTESVAVTGADGNIIMANKVFEAAIGTYLGPERFIDEAWVSSASSEKPVEKIDIDGEERGGEEDFTRFLELTADGAAAGRKEFVSLTIPSVPFELKASLQRVKSLGGEIVGTIYLFNTEQYK